MFDRLKVPPELHELLEKREQSERRKQLDPQAAAESEAAEDHRSQDEATGEPEQSPANAESQLGEHERRREIRRQCDRPT